LLCNERETEGVYFVWQAVHSGNSMLNWTTLHIGFDSFSRKNTKSSRSVDPPTLGAKQ